MEDHTVTSLPETHDLKIGDLCRLAKPNVYYSGSNCLVITEHDTFVFVGSLERDDWMHEDTVCAWIVCRGIRGGIAVKRSKIEIIGRVEQP